MHSHPHDHSDDHSAVAVFDTQAQALAASGTLEQRGFPRDRFTVVSHELESKDQLHGLVVGSDHNVTVGLGGGVTGGIVGFVLGCIIIGLARLTPIGDQFGIAILAAGVMGFVLAGIVFGSLIGAMLGRGLKESQIEPYDEQVRAGKVLIVAHGSHDEMTNAERLLRTAGAASVRVHHHVTAPADSTEAM